VVLHFQLHHHHHHHHQLLQHQVVALDSQLQHQPAAFRFQLQRLQHQHLVQQVASHLVLQRHHQQHHQLQQLQQHLHLVLFHRHLRSVRHRHSHLVVAQQHLQQAAHHFNSLAFNQHLRQHQLIVRFQLDLQQLVLHLKISNISIFFIRVLYPIKFLFLLVHSVLVKMQQINVLLSKLNVELNHNTNLLFSSLNINHL